MVRVDGVEYTAEAVEAARAELIAWRDQALEANPPSFHATVFLSHVIAYMAEYADLLKDPDVHRIIQTQPMRPVPSQHYEGLRP